MKALWLSALTAALLLLGNAAHAGDHHRGGDWDRGHHNGWDRHDHYDRRGRDCDEWGRYRSGGWGQHRDVYYRPVYYSPAPVYYGRVRGYDRRDEGEIHGSIRIGF